jgi:hypothetical protein
MSENGSNVTVFGTREQKVSGQKNANITLLLVSTGVVGGG